MSGEKEEQDRNIIVPAAYEVGLQAARTVDAELAERYVAHTSVGDPLADEMADELARHPRAESYLFIQAGMDNRPEDLRDAPPIVREFFEDAGTPPPWVDFDAFRPGVRMFHRDSRLVLAGMVGGVLVEGFASNISKSFFITGRLRDQGVRRLRQNNRHMVEIFLPHGLERFGDGWKLSVRIRLIHARVRKLLRESHDWQPGEWGTPISAAHVGLAITAFSARLLHHMKSLGAVYDDEERAGFMAVWRYSGYLMGIPESILFEDEAEALRIFKIGHICEPAPEIESVVMANSLVNAAPLVAGITEPKERRNLAKYVFSVSRALIGNEMADQLGYPAGHAFGVLPWFRFQSKYSRILDAVIPRALRNRNFANFQSLLDASVYEDIGITYALPDHVYSEESSRW